VGKTTTPAILAFMGKWSILWANDIKKAKPTLCDKPFQLSADFHRWKQQVSVAIPPFHPAKNGYVHEKVRRF
jgi:hypothetical protein